MKSIDSRIQPLDKTSQAKIKSSVQILCLNDVVLGLIRNAIDARASSIKVVLSYRRGFCSVLDDGHGIPSEEFAPNGHLAQPYCTSKATGESPTSGRHGLFLSAVAGVALLAIASRDGSDADIHCLWCDDSGRLRSGMESLEALDMEHGTSVKVHNLFAKFPVRRNHLADRFSDQLEVRKEFESLKFSITALVLAASRPLEIRVEHASASCRFHHKPRLVRSSKSAAGTRSVEYVTAALLQAGFIDHSQCFTWQTISLRSGLLYVHAVLSSEVVAHRLVQFVSVDGEPLQKDSRPELYQMLNALFESPKLGTISDQPQPDAREHPSEGSASRAARSDTRRNVDRWPMFVIWVDSSTGIVSGSESTNSHDGRIDALMAQIELMIGTMITEFLLSKKLLRPGRPKHGSQSCSLPIDMVGENGHKANRPSTRSLEGFEHWSRVKSSRPSGVNNLLTGLPFRDAKKQEWWEAVSLSNADPPSEHSESKLSLVEGTQQDMSSVLMVDSRETEQNTFWIDPQTGRTLQIDPRTGMVMPDKSNSVDSRGGQTAAASTAHRVRRSRKKHKGSQTIALLAENVRRYTESNFNRSHQPIRSISLFNDLGESHAERIQSHNKRVGHFWSGGADEICNHTISTKVDVPRVSRLTLSYAEVVKQVDKKFIMALVPGDTTNLQQIGQTRQLVLIDQHAADERCKVENLIRSLWQDEAVHLNPPLTFEVSAPEALSLDSLRNRFTEWRVWYEVSKQHIPDDLVGQELIGSPLQRVQITALPASIAERCRIEPKLIIDVLREEIWSENRPRRKSCRPLSGKKARMQHDDAACNTGASSHILSVSDMPPRLLDLLNSRACRSAIMFNDELSLEQCKTLVSQLSTCVLPFQCAHGRASMVVLSDLAKLPNCDALAAQHNPISPSGLPLDGDAQRPHVGHHPQNSISTGRLGLNTIDSDKVPSFGQAYRAWMATDFESDTVVSLPL